MNEHVLWLLEVFGIIAAAGSAGAVIWKVINPFKKHSDRLKAAEERLDKGDERFHEIAEMQKVLMKSQLALIDHEITGNGIDRMKDIRSELQTFLIEKSQ